MITLDDLAKVIVDRYTASAELVAALPGKVWLDRAPDEPAGDYAVFTLERAGSSEWESDGTYLAPWTLRVVAYTVQGRTGGSTPQQVQLALAAAYNADPTGWAALRAGRVNCCLPDGYDGKHAPNLREGRDVFAAAGQWQLTVEGNRA